MKHSQNTLITLLICIVITSTVCGCTHNATTVQTPQTAITNTSSPETDHPLLADELSRVSSPHNYKVTMQNGSDESTSEFIFYEDNKLAYVVIDTPGNRLYIDYQENLLIAYHKKLNRALSMPMDTETRSKPPFITVDDIDKNVPVESIEVLNGFECWRVNTTMPTSPTKDEAVIAWIDTDRGFIRKLAGKDRAAIVFEYSNVDKLNRADYVVPPKATMLRIGDSSENNN